MKRISLLILFLLIPLVGFSQPGPGGGGGPGAGEPVPIAGMGILLAAGAFFGAKKIFDQKNKKTS